MKGAEGASGTFALEEKTGEQVMPFTAEIRSVLCSAT